MLLNVILDDRSGADRLSDTCLSPQAALVVTIAMPNRSGLAEVYNSQALSPAVRINFIRFVIYGDGGQDCDLHSFILRSPRE
jgi:hypothetical protein